MYSSTQQHTAAIIARHMPVLLVTPPQSCMQWAIDPLMATPEGPSRLYQTLELMKPFNKLT
jgi:hypothetical protein